MEVQKRSSQFEDEARKKLQGLDVGKLRQRLQAVEGDIKNLEDELGQREDLLHFIDELIKNKRKKHS
ncbi:unnamed protein product [Blepharisma stoltei]|uniref:Uncharacterized protein n=1 Tax=Blepharisma stoltei TaxID=1481888 RepID=A0AAU9KBD0_9CILI|nr:unnamed protein product [Blepharisma stoltei]